MADNNRETWKKDEDCAGCREKPSLIERFRNGQFRFSLWYFVAIIAGLVLINSLITQRGPAEEVVEYSTFKELIETGEIKRVQLGSTEYYGYNVTREEAASSENQTDGVRTYKTSALEDPGLLPLLEERNVEYFAQPDRSSPLLGTLLSWVLPLGIFFVVWRLIFKRMGNLGSANVMNFNQNRSQIVAEGEVNVSFKDVAGADEAKQELEEVVDFLKNPQRYYDIGGKIPKGVLLVGSPGTGKTLMAKAVAGEADVTFFRMSGADFVEMFVGVGAARVRDLFKQAREKAPCIIFIDELDAIGKSRSSFGGGNDEREQTLNQLLVEMDGFDSRTGVIIIGATNRPEILDPALLRPGRFDRQVLVDKPDLAGREAILEIHSKDVKLDEGVSLNAVAQRTPGFSGADLANVVNEAALLAVRAGRKSVIQQDFEDAIEKIVAGLEKKNKLINTREKEIVAYHETGHALAAYFTEGAEQVQKISIIPRGMAALGYTLQVPTEDRYLMTKRELLGKIDVLLGGRAAEEIFFGEVSTGAANDLTKTTDIARKMITEYGMSEKFKNVVLPSQRSSLFLDQEAKSGAREYAETTQSYIDDEITRTVNERYDYVLALLKEKKHLLEKVAKELIDREVLNTEDFEALIDEPRAEVSRRA
jgi:cell division protease FtsH